MIKTLEEQAQALVTKARARLRNFKKAMIRSNPSFSYSWARSYRPEKYAALLSLEAEIDSAMEKPLRVLLDLNKSWLKIAVKLYSDQKQMEAEFCDGQPTH